VDNPFHDLSATWPDPLADFYDIEAAWPLFLDLQSYEDADEDLYCSQCGHDCPEDCTWTCGCCCGMEGQVMHEVVKLMMPAITRGMDEMLSEEHEWEST